VVSGNPESEPHEYCVAHDQPIDWCKTPDRCREIMKSWGLYPDADGESPAQNVGPPS
jgi:hypothetical protein